VRAVKRVTLEKLSVDELVESFARLCLEQDEALLTAEGKEILEVPVAKRETALRIWQSHPQWPKKVTVGLG